MNKLFFMMKVTTLEEFENSVLEMAKQKDAKLFHCYVSGDIFRIATAKRVQQFDFSSFDSDKEIIRFIQIALNILREKGFGEEIKLFSGKPVEIAKNHT